MTSKKENFFSLDKDSDRNRIEKVLEELKQKENPNILYKEQIEKYEDLCNT